MRNHYPTQAGKKQNLKSFFNLCIVFVLAVSFSLNAKAAVFNVTSLSDAGSGSLREAVGLANSVPGADIINIAVPGTINLTTGQMLISESLTINGLGINTSFINQTTIARVFITASGAISFTLNDITLNYTGPATDVFANFGGGAILTGGASSATTLTNVKISNFTRQIGNGGAVNDGSGSNVHSLTITNCIFENNYTGGGGGAVSYTGLGTCTITNSVFSGNKTGPNSGLSGANTGGDGGAVSVSGTGSGGTYLIEKNTFINNQALNTGGHAGAIMSTNGTATIRYNRFIGNTCANVSNPPLANVIGQAGGATTHVTIADNNWWGVNTGPGSNDATALAAGAVMTLTKWLQLKHTASPASINVSPAGGTTTLTAGFLSNSANEAIAASNLTALVGLPVGGSPAIFSNAVKGSLSNAQTAIQASGTATATYTLSNGQCPPSGTADAKIDNAIATASIIIVDNVPPQITCPANVTVQCAGDTAVDYSKVTATDNCPPVTLSHTNSISNKTCAHKFTITRTFTATDKAGNTATCTQVITVNDNVPPVITVKPNITVSCAGDVPPLSFSDIASASDNCTENVIISPEESTTNKTCANRYTVSHTYVATDECGNSATATRLIFVDDKTPPIITVKPNITVSCLSDVPPLSFDDIASASDNCTENVIISPELGIINVICANRLTVTHTYVATDECGNSATATRLFIVDDQTPPVLSGCPKPEVSLGINPAFIPTCANVPSPTATDGCGTATVTCSETAVAVNGCQRSKTITWKATDACGNTATCATVFSWAEDKTPPEVTCPANITVTENPTGSGTAVVTFAGGASDICGLKTLSFSKTSGSSFPLGTTTVTLTATDIGNNTSTCSFTITVNPACVINCPADITVNSDADACGTVVDYSAATTTGNCGDLSYSHASGSFFPVGVTPVTISSASTGQSCSFNVTVQDKTAPVPPPAPANITVDCINKVPPPPSVIPSATDNCDGLVEGVLSESPALGFGCVGNPMIITRTWTFTDKAGNSGTTAQIITIEDNIPPKLPAAPADITVQCEDNVPPMAALSGSDNCGKVLVKPTEIRKPGGCRNSFQIIRTWIATDQCGNSAMRSQTVTVRDDTPPNAPPAPANVTVQCLANVPTPHTMSDATDNCSGTVSPVFTQTDNGGTGCKDAPLVITRTWTYTDECGNSSVATQTITVKDDTPPSAPPAPANVTVQCLANVPTPHTMSNATDNCSGTVSPVFTLTDNGGTGCKDAPLVITRTWTYTDKCGNSSVATQTITVKDDTPPSAPPAPANVTVQCLANVPTPHTMSNATDNCSGAVSPVFAQTDNGGSGCVSDPLILTRTWTYTDNCGNSSIATQKITVIDNQAPTPPLFAQVLLEYKCLADVPAAGVVKAKDNCDGDVVGSLNQTDNGGTGCVGSPLVITRTWTFTDKCGNSSTASQQITVIDDVAPTLSNPTVNPSCLWPPNHKMRDVYVGYTVTDNCNASVTLKVTSNEPENGTGDGDTGPDWEIIDNHNVKLRAERSGNGSGRIYTITVTVKDACGNTITKSVTVSVAHDISSPLSGASYKIGSTVNFAGVFWDKPGNKHTASWLVDGTTVAGTVTAEPSGLKNGTVTGAYKFSNAGVYKLQMNVKDQTGAVSYANTRGDLDAIVVIYDPNGGYTYGGGWFASPAGSLKSNANATGKVSYGFNSNYFKGATNPKGETQMQFQIGNLEFNALNFDYLAISGAKAQYKGSGKIAGDQAGYNFIMTVIDGQATGGGGVDKIRLKIFTKAGTVIYDNQPGASDAADPTTAVGTGSTVVVFNTPALEANREPVNTTVIETAQSLQVSVMPNPSETDFRLVLQSNDKINPVHIRVMNINGQQVKVMKGAISQTYRFGHELKQGVYLVEVTQGKQKQILKLIKY